MRRRAGNPIDRHIASRLFILRKNLGMSQRQMSEIIKVSTPQYQKFEGAKNCIAASQLYMLIEELNIPADYFYRV